MPDLCIHAGEASLKVNQYTGTDANNLSRLLSDLQQEEDEVSNTRANWPVGASELHAPAC